MSERFLYETVRYAELHYNFSLFDFITSINYELEVPFLCWSA